MLTTETAKRQWIIDLSPLEEDEIEDAEFRGKDRAWSSLVKLFEERRVSEGLTFEQLGRRIGKPKTQVHRWMSSPFKMTLRAYGLLAEGLNGEIFIDVCARRSQIDGCNHFHPSERARAITIWTRTVTSTTASKNITPASEALSFRSNVTHASGRIVIETAT